VYLAQKIELKPNKSTKKYLNQCFGYSRYIFNKALNEWQDIYNKNKEDKSLPKPTHRLIRDRLKSIKEEWEDELPKMILETSC
jgi:putative transposase